MAGLASLPQQVFVFAIPPKRFGRGCKPRPALFWPNPRPTHSLAANPVRLAAKLQPAPTQPRPAPKLPENHFVAKHLPGQAFWLSALRLHELLQFS